MMGWWVLIHTRLGDRESVFCKVDSAVADTHSLLFRVLKHSYSTVYAITCYIYFVWHTCVDLFGYAFG